MTIHLRGHQRPAGVSRRLISPAFSVLADGRRPPPPSSALLRSPPPGLWRFRTAVTVGRPLQEADLGFSDSSLCPTRRQGAAGVRGQRSLPGPLGPNLGTLAVGSDQSDSGRLQVRAEGPGTTSVKRWSFPLRASGNQEGSQEPPKGRNSSQTQTAPTTSPIASVVRFRANSRRRLTVVAGFPTPAKRRFCSSPRGEIPTPTLPDRSECVGE